MKHRVSRRNAIAAIALTMYCHVPQPERRLIAQAESEWTREKALVWADGRRSEYEGHLSDLVAIPTVSALEEHRGDIGRGVEAAVELLRSIGAEVRVLKPAHGNPVVHGTLGEPGHAHVTIYNHLDVQPADEDGWTADPFSMTIAGDDYTARGTTDDKGPAVAALYGALLALERGVPIRISFLWEFEEEVGSPNFEEILAAHRESLQTDSVVVSDTIWVSGDQPAVPTGLRGLLGMVLKLRTGAADPHSGITGGLARNALAEIADALARCQDASSGRVKIPGFYARVLAPTAAELTDFGRSGFTLESFRQARGLHTLRKADALEAMQRLWCEPTFEVHGIRGGYQGEGIKTIVPQFAEAKISCRIVPGMTTDATFQLVRDFVQGLNPDIEVTRHKGLEPFRGTSTGPLAEAISAAIEFGFGRKPVLVREGGSIGAVVSMERVLRVPVMFLGLSLPEHGYHSVNERFDWPQARGGIVAFAEYFRQIAQLR